MTPTTRCAIVLIAGLSATLAACTQGPATQAQANVAQAQANGADSVNAAQADLRNTEISSDGNNAAATLRVASAQATSAHEIAIASCAEKPASGRDACTNTANQALTAANQKAIDAQVTADNAKPADAGARSSN
jgi:hypothetical protein